MHYSRFVVQDNGLLGPLVLPSRVQAFCDKEHEYPKPQAAFPHFMFPSGHYLRGLKYSSNRPAATFVSLYDSTLFQIEIPMCVRPYSTRHVCGHYGIAESGICDDPACPLKGTFNVEMVFDEKISEKQCPKCENERKEKGLVPEPTFWETAAVWAGDNMVGLICVVLLVGGAWWLGKVKQLEEL